MATDFEIQEGKSTIAAIVKENGSTKVIKTPADADLVYGSPVDTFAFLECTTSYGQDSSKTINKTDIVGTQNQKISEGSIEDTLSYDAIIVNAALGDHTIIINDENPFHGLDADVGGAGTAQYMLSALGLRKMIRSANTYTIRLFMGCDLDANGDADITTARDILDLERVHVGSVNTSISAGSDNSVSVSFDAEDVTFPAAYNTAPN